MSEEHEEKIKFYIKDHIGIFENALSPNLCKWLIDFFEYKKNFVFQRNLKLVQDQSITLGNQIDFLENNSSLVFNYDDLPNAWDDVSHIFWQHCYPKYVDAYPFTSSLTQVSMGYIKIQKTMPGQGYHTFHFENTGMALAKRVMFLIIYLNDIEEGGETEFLTQSIRIKPKAGTIVIAPAYYTHPHRGNPPLKENKYIVTTWLEYVQ